MPRDGRGAGVAAFGGTAQRLLRRCLGAVVRFSSIGAATGRRITTAAVRRAAIGCLGRLAARCALRHLAADGGRLVAANRRTGDAAVLLRRRRRRVRRLVLQHGNGARCRAAEHKARHKDLHRSTLRGEAGHDRPAPTDGLSRAPACSLLSRGDRQGGAPRSEASFDRTELFAPRRGRTS